MIQLITQIAVAVGALCGVFVIIYKYWLSPSAKKKAEEEKKVQDSINSGDPGGLL